MCEYKHFTKDIKTAFRLALERAGGVNSVADTLKAIFGRGCNAGWLSKYASQEHPYCPPMHIAFAVDKLAAHPFCAEVLARHLHYHLTPVAVVKVDKAAIISGLAHVAEANGKLSAVALDAISDGIVTENEKRMLRECLAAKHEAEQCIEELTV